MDMYSDSGEDATDDKPLHVNSTEEQVNPEGKPEGATKAKRRKTKEDPVNHNDVTVSVEDEPMSDGEAEQHEQVDEDMKTENAALIKEEKPVDHSTKEKLKQTDRTKKQPKAEISKDCIEQYKNVYLQCSASILNNLILVLKRTSLVKCSILSFLGLILNLKVQEVIIFIQFVKMQSLCSKFTNIYFVL